MTSAPAHAAWSCLDWQDAILLPLLSFPDLASLACVSRDMRQLVQQSSFTSSFVHHQRGYRLWRELDPDLPSILRHSSMPPRFVRECLYGWGFLSYLASRGRLRAELDLQGLFLHAYASSVSFFAAPSQYDAHRLRLSQRLLSVHLNAYATESDAESSKNVWTEVSFLAAEYRAFIRTPSPRSLGCTLV